MSTVWADIVACTGVGVHGNLSEHEMYNIQKRTYKSKDTEKETIMHDGL